MNKFFIRCLRHWQIPRMEKKIKQTLLLLFLFSLNVQANSNPVSTKFSLNFKNVELEQVLTKIEAISEFRFLYESNQLNLAQKVSLRIKEKEIKDILKLLFEKTNIRFKVLNRQVVLTKATPTPLSLKEESQPLIEREDSYVQIQVSGTITDTEGQPLPGANVLEKGTTNGTQSDFDGNFILNVSNRDVILVISYLGFKTREIPLSGQSTLSVQLAEDAAGLDEVVIVGYGVQKKANITGAITSVKVDELNNISNSNLSNTLAGRAPGVVIAGSSGLTGASSSVRIRGAFGEPLYVIDGIVRDKEAFDALNSSEVDQLSFLKDAASASIYGSRAGNGVVLVTTKQGVRQEPTFSYQGSFTTSSPTQQLLSDQTTATDELIYQNRVAEYMGTPIPNGAEEFDYFKNLSYNVNDFIWNNPQSNKHSLSVSGGTDKITYYSLASYHGEKGSYKNLKYDKVNLRSNVTAQISDDIKLNLNISANQRNHNRFYWPFSPDDDYDVSDLYRVTFNWPKVYPFYTTADGTPADYVTDYPVQTPMGSWLAWSVIDQVIGDRYIKTRQREVNSILSLDIDLGKLVPGLSTKIYGNYLGSDYMRKKYLTFQKNYVFNQADPDGNRFIPGAPDPNKTNTFTFSRNQEFLSYDINTLWSYQLNWQLNYMRTFEKSDFSGMLVLEQGENGGYGAFAQAEDPVTNYDQMFVYSTDSERRYGDGWEQVGARQSAIGRFNYNYDQRYIAEFSFRYDGNTLFPKNKRWGFFPSMSLAWRLNNEHFMEKYDTWLDDLKLRLSYGTTGNDLDVNNRRISPFGFRQVYRNAGSYIFGNNLYRSIAPGVTPNPNLTWATSTTYNAGFDAAILKNRLVTMFDIFYKKEEDILGSRLVTLPDNYGQDLAPENYAARSWKGLEFSAIWRDMLLDNELSYSINANIGYAKDQWDVLDEGASFQEGGSLAWQSKIGQPLNRIIGLKNVGMVRSQEQLDELLAAGFKQFGRDPYLGALIFEDIRGDGYSEGPDGKIDGNDMQVLSNNAAPRINYGFGFNVEYKGFVVNTHFQGVGMYDRIISNKEGPGMRQHGGSIRPYYPIWAKDVWTPDNPDAKYPRPVGKNWYESGTGASSFWIRNGAYLRLKNLNIGYNLPVKWTSLLSLNHAQVFFNGTNLFAISEMKEFHDPEQKEYDSYPLMKSFTLGLNINF